MTAKNNDKARLIAPKDLIRLERMLFGEFSAPKWSVYHEDYDPLAFCKSDVSDPLSDWNLDVGVAPGIIAPSSSNSEYKTIVISHEEIANLNFAPVLQATRHDIDPSGAELADTMGKYHIRVEGYGDSPFRDRQVAEFFQKLNRKWPFWFFFLDLPAQWHICMLITLSIACLECSLRTGVPFDEVDEVDFADMASFIDREFFALACLMFRSEMDSLQIQGRMTRIGNGYFRYANDSGVLIEPRRSRFRELCIWVRDRVSGSRN